MKKIKTTEAIGHVLCHDVTQIIAGQKKDALFRKGHIVRAEDIEPLLSIGKDTLFIWENREGYLHENEAAERLYNVCKSEYMHPSEVKEGKIEVIADIDGLLKVDVELLEKINSMDQLMIATRHGNFAIKKGDKIAGTRVIPLVIEESRLITVEQCAKGKSVLSIKPFTHKKVGIVTTGNEVFFGRIKDAFGPVVIEKLNGFDVTIMGQIIVNDDPEKITEAINAFIEQGADMVICTGGMSVDPDDTTPLAIRNTGAKVIRYGAPVLPGAMMLVSYIDDRIPVVGLPGCVMYGKRTIFDLILPRLMADDLIEESDISKLGHGGLCLNCSECTFPQCSFGR